MGTGGLDADVADVQAGDFRDAKPAAAREADQGQIEPGVGGSRGLALEVAKTAASSRRDRIFVASTRIALPVYMRCLSRIEGLLVVGWRCAVSYLVGGMNATRRARTDPVRASWVSVRRDVSPRRDLSDG